MSQLNDYGNEQVKCLPDHLKRYIVPQYYEQYTPVDQAVWRYVMRQNYHFLKDVAHYPYIPGLKKAGLTIERIPDLQGMNDALGRFGWGAVTVNGFIPPAAFMEFQAHQVLVIAADIRQLDHIGYTPAPDIIHESAGHAPIIAEEDYHQYLSYFGRVGMKAISSAADQALYEAIRELSVLKEQPGVKPDDIATAERRLQVQQENMGEPSEMALLSRLHWWTVEYGLIGTLEHYKIYGAGLLSSISESASCLQPDVIKLPYTIDAVNYAYDITKPQPQLFVTPDFRHLYDVLEIFAGTMAFRRGGLYGLQKAKAAGTICTAVYSSGLQVSGVVSDFISAGGKPVYLQTTGPTTLSVNDTLLSGHGPDHHPAGFGSPVGRLKNYDGPLENMLPTELVGMKIFPKQTVHLAFESGITVSGTVTRSASVDGKLVLISFRDCAVKNGDGQLLFEPGWGTYDMAVGEQIVSVFGGTADRAVPIVQQLPASASGSPISKPVDRHLQKLYQRVRSIRENKEGYQQLKAIWQTLTPGFPEEWLLPLEILELLTEQGTDDRLAGNILVTLKVLATQRPDLSKLIRDGLSLIDQAYAAQEQH